MLKILGNSVNGKTILAVAQFCHVVSEQLIAVVIIYGKVSRTVCIEPEESLTRSIQSNIDQDAYARVILERNGLNVIHVIIFGKFLLIIVRVGITVTFVSGCYDNNIDVLILGKFLCRICDVIELLSRKEISIITDLNALCGREVHEDIENDARNDYTDKCNTYTDRSTIKLAEYRELRLILAVVILN